MAADVSCEGRTLGEFHLLERIDEGGFGAVYLARQEGLARPVVVKVLHRRAPAADASLQRFVREAQLAAQVGGHPYAAHVYALGVEDDGLLWIAMELVQGVSLRRYLAARGPMPLEVFAPFFERVAQVVHAAHRRGIVHRDLKPENIMVLEEDDALMPKLLDFGVAKLIDASAPRESVDDLPPPSDRPIDGGLTPDSWTVGCPAYMAPEQWTAPADVGPAADIYALGVIAYEALHGPRPYRGATAAELCVQHCEDPIPAGCSAAIRRALAKDPRERHGSVLELAAALRGEADALLVAQIRGAARAWHDRRRPADLLWHGSVLADLEGWQQRTSRAVAGGALTKIELAFVEASLVGQDRRVTRARQLGVLAAIVAVGIVVGVVQFRAMYETRLAQQSERLAHQRAHEAERVAAATALTAEVEQGRAALLHGDIAEAQRHLGAAWDRGDRSGATAFMYARALEPSRAELARLPAARGRMWWAGWSPDGRMIATTDDFEAQIWDGAGYGPRRTLPHGDAVYAATWAGPDRLVTACGDGAVRIWDAATGELVRELRLRGRAPRWYAIAVSPAGRIAAVDAKGRIAAAWDATTGAVLLDLALGGAGWPAAAFSADGRWLAASGGGSTAIIDTTTWRRAVDVGERIRAIAWDPTGPRLLSGSATGDAAMWNATGAAVLAVHQLGEPVTAIAWSPDGRRAAIAGEDGEQLVVDTATGNVVSKGNHLHSRISSIAFSADGQRSAAAGASGDLAIGDASSGLPVELLGGLKRQLGAVSFAPGGRRVIAASWDGSARIWSAGSPYRQWSAAAIGTGYGLFGGAAPDGRYLAVQCPGCATRVWDTAHDQLLAELPAVAAPDDNTPVPFPAVSAAGDLAAIARGNAAELYELPGGRLLRTVRHAAPVTAVAFGPGGELVSGSADGAVLVTRGGDTVALAAPGAAGIAALAVLAAGRIAVADAAARGRILDARGTAIAAFGTGVAARMLRPSPDGRRVLVVPFHAGKTAPMILIEVDQGMVIELEGPPVFAARWVASGSAILSAHADGAARLWSSDGAIVRTYTGGARLLSDADLSPDGTVVMGGGGDGMLRFWDTATGQPLWIVAAHRTYVMGVHFEDGAIVTRGIGGEIARSILPDPAAVIRGVKSATTLPSSWDMVRSL